MTPVTVLGAVLVLVATIGIGTVAHELSHALALRAFGVPYETEWLPSRDEGLVLGRFVGRSPSVRLRNVPHNLSPWCLRIAALMPLLLAVPFALALLGVFPDLLQTGDAPLSAAAIGWLACALPSPADFSLFWYADRVIDRGVEYFDSRR